MKASPKYAAAAGCAKARLRQADFCAAVQAQAKEAEIKAAKRDMDAGRPAAVDPQAETLASLTGFKVESSFDSASCRGRRRDGACVEPWLLRGRPCSTHAQR